MPRSVQAESERQLNQACADRVFVDIFRAGYGLLRQAVNATVYGGGTNDEVISDRDHRAHVFSTFGLATIEYPAHQVTEACAKRLLAYALREWQGRGIEGAESVLDNLDLTWQGLREALLQTAAHGGLREASRGQGA